MSFVKQKGLGGLFQIWKSSSYVLYNSNVWKVTENSSNKVLGYHSVGGGSFGHIEPDRFRSHLDFLDTHYDIVDLPEVLHDRREKSVALTFDDGFKDFYEHVLPILREYNAPATVYIITDTLDDSSFTHDGRENEYLSHEEIEELVDEELVTIGNHTRSHPFLSEITGDELKEEIVGAKERLEQLFDVEITRFSYPSNNFSSEAVTIARESHEIAVTRRGNRKLITPDIDPALVPRVKGESADWQVKWELTDVATKIGRSVQYLGIEA